MRESDGRIVVIDFSLSHGDPAQADLAGTPVYLSPELFAGAAASTRSDIYSVGVLLYYLLTAAYPVSGKTIADVAQAHQRDAARRLRDVRGDLAPPLMAVIDRASHAIPTIVPRRRVSSKRRCSRRWRTIASIRAARLRDSMSRRWAIGAAAIVATVTTPSLNALRLYTDAYTIASRNQWPAAMILAEQAVDADPSFAAAHLAGVGEVSKSLPEGSVHRSGREGG